MWAAAQTAHAAVSKGQKGTAAASSHDLALRGRPKRCMRQFRNVIKEQAVWLLSSWRGLGLESSYDPATEDLRHLRGGPNGACGSFETS